MDLPLAGRPAATVADALATSTVCVVPGAFGDIKPRLLVAEGDTVKRGTPLFYNKRNDALKVCAPAGGKVRSVQIGQRRSIRQIVIEVAGREEVESFRKYRPEELADADREELLAHLQRTGYLVFIRQRPFSRMADPKTRPKSIFVNGMATAPFQADLHVAVRGNEAAFQAGLDALTRLTDGKVHLCLAAGAAEPSPAVTGAKNVALHYFSGPHPSGNTSVHIHHIDPIEPHDVVWTIRGVDLILIGRLLLDGALPASRVIALGGPGVRAGSAGHYRVRMNTSLEAVLDGRLADGEQRIVAGDVLAGTKVGRESHLGLTDSSITVLPEGRERHLMGWIAPGLNVFSRSRTFLSKWFTPNRTWALDTNMHGSLRSMVLTGLYDRYLPMDIMADFLVRAVLAHDVDEAIKLGLLETDPEDFALCAFACPSKMDLVGIIRRGLAEVEKEGI